MRGRKRHHRRVSPPTEQLVRDYLNRLSMAARGQLSAEERRVLVTVAHDFIERTASESGTPTAMEVAALLSRLGDPGALVEQEAARLAEARGETAEPAGDERTGRLTGMLRRRNTPASWHWPAAPGNPDLVRELLEQAAARPVATGAVRESRAARLTLRVPRQSGPQAAEAPDIHPAWPSAAPREGRPQPDAAQETAATGLTGPDADPADAAPVAGRPAAAGDVRALLASVASRALDGSRRFPMEATAVILLGLGGVIYPPVWVLGACLALASKVWDYRDKWAGLAGPVVLTIIGTAACLALGTSRSGFGQYLHQTWVYLNIWSRVGAAAGTWYLVWRLAHERHDPDTPPWSRPHRVD